MAKSKQLWIKLISSADTGFFYVTHKNPKKNTEKLTLNEYNAGTVDFTTVVVAQTSALSARLSLAQMRVSQQTTAVTLIQDLGGGWKAPDYSHYQ